MTDLANSAKLVFFLVEWLLAKAALKMGMIETTVPIAFANVKHAVLQCAVVPGISKRIDIGLQLGRHHDIELQGLSPILHIFLTRPLVRENSVKPEVPATLGHVVKVCGALFAMSSGRATQKGPRHLRNSWKSSPAPEAPPKNRIAPNAKQRLAPFWSAISPVISSL